MFTYPSIGVSTKSVGPSDLWLVISMLGVIHKTSLI